MSRIYVASSWRNTYYPSVIDEIREAGHEVLDWRNPRPGDHGFSWNEIDPSWARVSTDPHDTTEKQPRSPAVYRQMLEPELMYLLADAVCTSIDELLEQLA